MRVTARQVADRAGVSLTTVSRVINNSGYVEAGLRTKIETVMQELGYIPNKLAKNLATGRTRTIGLVITSLQSPFFVRATEGIQDVLEENDYHLVLCNTKFDVKIELGALQMVRQGLLDGLITTAGSQTRLQMIELVRQNYPVVFINRLYEELKGERYRSGYVLADLEYSGHTVTEYLIRLGHRHIGIISGDHNSTANKLRLQGYQSTLESYDYALKPGLIKNVPYPYDSPRSVGQWGYSETLELLQTHPEITSLMVFYHPMLPGVLQAIREVGKKVPEDISVVGFDDFPLAPYLNPPLTVMTQPVYEMGRAAARLLLQQIEGENTGSNEPVVLRPELIIRGSCGASPALSGFSALGRSE